MQAFSHPGESYIREVAAFQLDFGNWAGVPETAFAWSKHPSYAGGDWKRGSIQAFAESVGTIEQLNLDLRKISAESVHRIGLFDLRILNQDRNDGNLLVMKSKCKDGVKLTPIDHGHSLSTVGILAEEIIWMRCPQAHEKFSGETLQYIEMLSGDRDAALLQFLGLPAFVRATVRTMVTFLQMATKAGMTLYQIGEQVYRKEEATPSSMEDVLLGSKNLEDLLVDH